ncbi:MAG: peroxisome- protein [Thelocarpon impressellum]|nr:MAG: peroxisome- protein [Thelocarpon impressellum]
MSTTPSRAPQGGPAAASQDPNAPTYASFSPASVSHVPASTRQRSTILVHQKSPLLVATPPQITRALAYSHPFLLPLNKLAGLLSWTSGDPWESFLVVAGFWAVTLYGDVVLQWGAPLLVVMGLVLGMYSRRYSPLSSTGHAGAKPKTTKKRRSKDSAEEEGITKHQKSLDEIVETLNIFTFRCNVLLDPLLALTDFLSTQQSATSATTRPALTTLFIRILTVTPIWLILSLPPVRLVTVRRLVLVVGTVILTWHSRPARVSRAILWRSSTVRRLCAVITGLDFRDATPKSPVPAQPEAQAPSVSPRFSTGSTTSLGAKLRPGSSGVRFTFILYENERRWIGLGWTHSLFAYERAAWTDEHLNPAPAKDSFELPEVEGPNAEWQWVQGSEWQVEGALEGEEGGPKGSKSDKASGGGGWIYYDNKASNPYPTCLLASSLTVLSGEMGAAWYRDAELVEVADTTPRATPAPDASTDAVVAESDASTLVDVARASSETSRDDDEISSSARKRKWFRSGAKSASGRSSSHSVEVDRPGTDEDHSTIRLQQEREGEWGVGDDAEMGLS